MAIDDDPQVKLMAATAGAMDRLSAPVPEIRFHPSYWESVNREMDEWARSARVTDPDWGIAHCIPRGRY